MEEGGLLGFACFQDLWFLKMRLWRLVLILRICGLFPKAQTIAQTLRMCVQTTNHNPFGPWVNGHGA